MQKNKFEKQVQQKMEELKLDPSGAVWQNIEPRISSTKRRKWAWIFFPLLLICLLCGGYFLWHQNIEGNINNEERKTLTNKHSTRPVSNLATKPVAETSITGKGPAEYILMQKQKLHLAPSIKNGRNPVTTLHKVHKVNITIRGSELETSPITQKNQEHNIPAHPETSKGAAAARLRQNKNPAHGNMPDIQEESIALSEQTNQSDGINKHDSSQAWTASESARKTDPEKNGLTAPKQTPGIKHKTKSKWIWGLTFSAGVSGIPNTFLGSLDKSYSAADALSISYPPQNSSATLPSGIESAEALVTGFFVQKDISKRKMITAGLNYKVFSLTSKVGQRVVSTRGSYDYSSTNPVNKYHNYFHFIELPVSLKIQLHSGKIPLYLEGGVSVSKLISSNALQFNTASISYYNKNSSFNTLQVGFNTALYVAFFSKTQNTRF